MFAVPVTTAQLVPPSFRDGTGVRGAGLAWEGSLARKMRQRVTGKGALPDRGRGVLQLPPGLGGVQIAAPQLPVKALGGQRVLFDLKVVIFDVVKGWGDDPFPVLLYSGEHRFSPEQEGGREALLLPR